MKRVLPALVLVLSLLSGCAGGGGSAGTAQAENTTVPSDTDEQLLIDQTGQLNCYELSGGVCAGIYCLGGAYAVATAEQELCLLSGEQMQVQSRRELDVSLSAGDPSIVSGDGYLAYFDSQRQAYVILDGQLNETSLVSIQEELSATPLMSPDLAYVYYACQSGLRVMDMATGTSRLLRQETGQVLSLDGLLFDGTVLFYTRQAQDGSTQCCFVSTSDGQLLERAAFQGQILSWGECYGAVLELEQPLGTYREIITGSRDGSSGVIEPEEAWDGALLDGSGYVVIQRQQTDSVLLQLVELESGCLTATAVVEGQTALLCGVCRDGQKLWLWDGTSSRFYCWEPGKRQLESGSLLAERYTLEEPDQTGLDRCGAAAQKLSQRFGVQISIVQGDNRTKGVDYSLYSDHRPEQYALALERLEQIMEQFPADFWQAVQAETTLQICLVDDFDPLLGVREGTGQVEQDSGAKLSISICQDLDAIFLHELFHVMETEIHIENDSLSGWNGLNPEGFQYCGNASAVDLQAAAEYLETGSNAFVDHYAMASGWEDRAQTFLYALQEDQQERFESDTMQAKLAMLCAAIRETFGLAEYAGSLPWEQYLAGQ